MRVPKFLILCLILFSVVIAKPSQKPPVGFFSTSLSTDYSSPFLQKILDPASFQIRSEELLFGQRKKMSIEFQTSQIFHLNLSAGQFIQLKITKGDLGLRVRIFTPREVLIRDIINTRFEDLRLGWISETEGKYTIQITSLERELNRDYALDILQPHPADFTDYEILKYSLLFAEGENLFAEGNLPSFQLALEKYQSAFEGLRRLNSYTEAARSAARIGEIYLVWGDNRKAFDYFKIAFDLSNKDSNQLPRLTFLNLMARSLIYLGKMTEARRISEKVLASSQKQRGSVEHKNFLKEESWAILNIAEILYSEGDLKGSLYGFTNSKQKFIELGDRYGEAFSNLMKGHAYSDLGYLDDARNCHQSGLALFEEISNVKGKALSLTALGGNYSLRGEQHQALAFHNKALLLFRQLGDSQFEGVTFNGIARAYVELNQSDLAYNFYAKSVALFQNSKNIDFEAGTQLKWGQTCHKLNREEEALTHYRRGFELCKSLGKKRLAAYALMYIAATIESQENPETAVSELKKSLGILKSVRDRRGQAQIFTGLGDIYYRTGNHHAALKSYRQALVISQSIEDKRHEAQSFYNIALTTRSTGELDESLKNIEQSLRIMEKLRVLIANEVLRLSYFSAAAQYYDFYINLLMQLNKLRPKQNYEIRAWQASEKIRARVLLESLSLAKVNVSQTQNPALRDQEEKLTRAINEQINLHSKLITMDKSLSDVNKSAQELRQLFINYEELQKQIKKDDSSTAALESTETYDLQAVKEILQDDPNTVFMDYLLTDEKGYLWTIDGENIRSYELPSRTEIDKASREFNQVLTARQPLDNETAAAYQQRYNEAENMMTAKACRLSRMLIPSEILQSDKKRLLIIPDKTLNYISFDALSASCFLGSVNNDSEAVYVPLITKYETAVISSATTLGLLRKQNSNRVATSNFAVILADPVFEADDLRITTRPLKKSSSEDSPDSPESADVVKKEIPLRRLRSSLEEAKQIAELEPDGKTLILSGFDANLTESKNPRLKDYQIIHFATHSLVDDKIPELSGIYLSQFNQGGESINGVLRLANIYNLDINAELIILSSCDSAIGQDVAGEGLISLSRGFLSAGAKSVIGSLWKVDDQATAELMNHFYKSLINDKMTVSGALRNAKLKMLAQKRWQSPFFWSGFVLQGEFNNKIFVSRKRSSNLGLIVAALLIMAIAILVGIKSTKILRRK